MVGICGSPGAGKSTLAQSLVEALNEADQKGQPAALVPMDGFHLPNSVLVSLGLRHLKGIPETFDAQGFVRLLSRLRDNQENEVPVPIFDRWSDSSIDDALSIKKDSKILIVEGNYLLMRRSPWDRIKGILDEVWFLESNLDLIRPRLIARHMAGGLSEEEAVAKVESTDLPNSILIEECRALADAVIFSPFASGINREAGNETDKRQDFLFVRGNSRAK